MRLVSATKVASSLGFDPGVQESVFAGAVLSATSSLAAMLRTAFDRAIVQDTFYILPNQSLPFARNVFRTRLALSRGLVQSISVLSYASSLEGLTGGSVNIESRYTTINMEKGEVVITGPDLRDQFVTVTYTAGLTVDGENNYEDVPGWLAELARQQAIIEIDIVAPTLRSDEGTDRSVEEMRRDMENRASRHIRYFPNAVRPIG